MADDDNDDSSKTEEPSQRKLDEAKKKGQSISSKEINHFFMMLSLLVFLRLVAPEMGREMVDFLGPFITQPETFQFDEPSLTKLFHFLVQRGMFLMLIPAMLGILAAFGPSILQNKWLFSTESMIPKLSKLSPLAGFKKLYNWKGIIDFLRNLLKITVVATVAIMILLPYRDKVIGSLRGDNTDILVLASHLAGKVMLATCIILFFLSCGDYFYQRFIFLKSMRMTKQEVKDEYKQQEGDPHVKGKFKQIRRDKARRRMMANVPKANVIITNPTHFAVALQYEADTMQAPKMVAKGADDVAARIREIAEKNKIPIVRNPPLARALYDATEVDETIPVQHYQAVARVISYVYKIKGRTMQRPKTRPTVKVSPKK